MKKLNERLLKDLAEKMDLLLRYAYGAIDDEGASMRQLADVWLSAVAPHRNPDGTIRVFVEEGDDWKPGEVRHVDEWGNGVRKYDNPNAPYTVVRYIDGVQHWWLLEACEWTHEDIDGGGLFRTLEKAIAVRNDIPNTHKWGNPTPAAAAEQPKPEQPFRCVACRNETYTPNPVSATTLTFEPGAVRPGDLLIPHATNEVIRVLSVVDGVAKVARGYLGTTPACLRSRHAFDVIGNDCGWPVPAAAEQPAPEIVFGPDENGVFIYKIPGLYPYWLGHTVNGQSCALSGHKTLEEAMAAYDRHHRKSYTVNGHRLEIVADPVMIGGEQVDVVRCPDGKYLIVRRSGKEYYNTIIKQCWEDNRDGADVGYYLTAAAAIADRAHLAGGAA